MQANIHGVGIHYETQGDGPPVVFVHGLGGTSNVWHAQRVTLSKNFRVVTYDLSGSGRSDRSRRQYSIDGWADELAGLMDHLSIPAAVVVGHSMGTVVVQRFAAKYAKRPTAIVLAGALVDGAFASETQALPTPCSAAPSRPARGNATWRSPGWCVKCSCPMTRHATPAIAEL